MIFFSCRCKRLYQVCTSSSKSCMSMKDLVSCLALIYYGSIRERMQRKQTKFDRKKTWLYTCFFLFSVLYVLFTHNTSNSNGILRRQDVEDFLSQCGDPSPEELDTLFQNVMIFLSNEHRFFLCAFAFSLMLLSLKNDSFSG